MFFEQRTLSICWFSRIWPWFDIGGGWVLVLDAFFFFCWGEGGCRIALWGSQLPWVYCIIFINKTLLAFPPKSYPMYRHILASGDLCPLPRRKRETRELNRSTQWMGVRAQARASASSCTKQVFKPFFFQSVQSWPPWRVRKFQLSAPLNSPQQGCFEVQANLKTLPAVQSRRTLLGKFCFWNDGCLSICSGGGVHRLVEQILCLHRGEGKVWLLLGEGLWHSKGEASLMFSSVC